MVRTNQEGDKGNSCMQFNWYLSDINVMAFYDLYEKKQSNNNQCNVWAPRKALSFERT